MPYHEYPTAKSALIGYTRNLATDIDSLGIRANFVALELVYKLVQVFIRKSRYGKNISQTLLKRIASPEGPTIFWVSESSFITGQIIYVDGG